MSAAEGHTSLGNYSVVITNSEDVVLGRCLELWESCFGLRARIAGVEAGEEGSAVAGGSAATPS